MKQTGLIFAWWLGAVALVIAGETTKTNITTATGLVYTNAIVLRIEPDGLTLMLPAGIKKIPFADLAPEVQVAYGYDAEKAMAYQKKKEEERKDTLKKDAIMHQMPSASDWVNIRGLWLGMDADAAKNACRVLWPTNRISIERGDDGTVVTIDTGNQMMSPLLTLRNGKVIGIRVDSALIGGRGMSDDQFAAAFCAKHHIPKDELMWGVDGRNVWEYTSPNGYTLRIYKERINYPPVLVVDISYTPKLR